MSGNKIDTSNLSVLECRREEVSEKDILTVGTEFKLVCPTESFILNPSKLNIQTEIPYQVQILGSELQPDGRLVLRVTSYKVGEFNSNEVILTDGVNKLALHGIQFKVESVIDSKNPPTQPYGPFGGHILYLPPLYLWTILSLVGLFIFYGCFKFIRKWQRKKLIEGLKRHDSRLNPQTQLHVRFRQLERQRYLESEQKDKVILEVDEILRIFIIRKFIIPAQDWSDRTIMSDFQNRYSYLGDELIKELKILLRETRKLKEFQNPQIKDIEQLVKKIKRWVDQVDRLSVTHQRRYEVGL